jgi:hypothetical protein
MCTHYFLLLFGAGFQLIDVHQQLLYMFDEVVCNDTTIPNFHHITHAPGLQSPLSAAL